MEKQLFNISDEFKSTKLEICVLGTLYVYKQGVGKPRGLFHHIFLGWATQRVSQHIPNLFYLFMRMYEIFIRRNSMYIVQDNK
jgi:hypothetical protein